jgi:hypothetical protein
MCVLTSQNCVLTCMNFLCNERDLKYFINIRAEIIAKGLINSI